MYRIAENKDNVNTGRQKRDPKKNNIFGSCMTELSDIKLIKGSAYLKLYNIHYLSIHVYIAKY